MQLVRRFLILLAVNVLLATASSAQMATLPAANNGATLVLGRYTTQSADPPSEASEPLDVVAQISFPRAQVQTIGDAVRHTLLRTGYTLLDRSGMSAEAGEFLTLPLPESQREIGPYRVKAILDVLLGSTWQWQRDPVRRRLWFTVAPAYAALVQAPPAVAAVVVPADTASSPPPSVSATPVAIVPPAPPPLPKLSSLGPVVPY